MPVFVVCEMFPKTEATHAAVLAEIFPREALRLIKGEARRYGVRLRFQKLVRRHELLAWAERHNARILLSPDLKAV